MKSKKAKLGWIILLLSLNGCNNTTRRISARKCSDVKGFNIICTPCLDKNPPKYCPERYR